MSRQRILLEVGPFITLTRRRRTHFYNCCTEGFVSSCLPRQRAWDALQTRSLAQDSGRERTATARTATIPFRSFPQQIDFKFFPKLYRTNHNRSNEVPKIFQISRTTMAHGSPAYKTNEYKTPPA
jgi:hypothetical protein